MARIRSGPDNIRMGRSFFFSLIISVLALNLLGCSSSGREVSYDPLTPLPNEFLPQDLEDHVLDAAIQEYLKLANAPLCSSYDFTRVDLDGDNRRDALVMMKGPHNYWCNMGGCSLIVFKAANDHFEWSSNIFPVRGPLYVSDTTSEGWKNLIIRVTGQPDKKAKNVAMQFDGFHYPKNPLTQPPIQSAQINHGQRLFP
jgi:hypothetical protein